MHQELLVVPHSYKILHQKLVNSLRWVGHVHLALAISEVRFLHNVRERSSMVEMKARDPESPKFHEKLDKAYCVIRMASTVLQSSSSTKGSEAMPL